MNILITGANSFIAKFLIPALNSLNYNIIATWRQNKPSFIDSTGVSENITYINLDFADESSFSIINTPIDAIIHIAGISVQDQSPFDFIESNVLPLHNIINFAKKLHVSKFIFFSSMSVYGEISDSVVTESTHICNPDIYGISKYVSELMLKDSGLNTLAIRLPSVLGVNAHRHWLSKVLNLALSNSPIKFYNPNAQFNNAVHVIGLIDFIEQVLKVNWSGFHAAPIGASGATNISDVVETIKTFTKSTSTLEPVIGQKPSFTISSDYLINQFNYSPININEVLKMYATENFWNFPFQVSFKKI
jgi:UDP-glucose 4-epimerase